MTTVKSRTDAMDSDNNSGTQVSSQIQMYLKHNHDDCLASAVEVFATALGFVINNPNLVTCKKSAEILRDDGSESYLLLKSVETQINTNLRIVTDLSQLKTKQLETRLQGCRELSPECCIDNKSKLGQKNLTRTYLIENKENGLARPVALFSAQGVENELESIISSLELLRAGVLLLLLNLEYPMTTTNFSSVLLLVHIHMKEGVTTLRLIETSEVRIEGLENVDYLDYLQNKKRCTEKAQAVTFDSEVDKVYLGTPHMISVIDRQLNRTFTIHKDGALPDIVVWNPWRTKAKEIFDLGNKEYRNFVCVEAAAVENAITLDPGEVWTGTQRLSVHHWTDSDVLPDPGNIL